MSPSSPWRGSREATPSGSQPTAWYALWRLVRICSTIGLYLTGYAIRRPFARRDRAALFGRILVSCLQTCGPTFVKIGQLLSSRYDLFEADTIAELRKLQDHVAPFDGTLVDHVRQELGEKFQAFAVVDEVPIASGSIAQIHRARTRDGREVILKIRRLGIESMVRSDFAALRLLAGTVTRSGLATDIPLRDMVDEMFAFFMWQLDFEQEAENYRIFRTNLSAYKTLTLPAVIPELSLPSVLVLDYVPGLVRVEHLQLSECDRRSAALTGLHALYHMIFVDGFVHADMHPGNIFFGVDAGVVLIDVGLTAQLSPKMRCAFADFFFGLAMGTDDCARVVWETAIWRKANCDRGAFEKQMRAVIERHGSLPAADFEVTRFVIDVFDAQRRAGICGTTAFMMVILALLTYEGVVKILWPELDFQGEARDFILDARLRARSA